MKLESKATTSSYGLLCDFMRSAMVLHGHYQADSYPSFMNSLLVLVFVETYLLSLAVH